MYAIIFQISDSLPEEYSKTAYSDIRKFMESNGFTWQQGNVYFGNQSINAVTCVITVQRLAATFPWFRTYVKDVRMLRIEEVNDLLPAII
jgi:virulence-associated protein VapD